MKAKDKNQLKDNIKEKVLAGLEQNHCECEHNHISDSVSCSCNHDADFDCECEECECEHTHNHNHKSNLKFTKKCILNEDEFCSNCGACDVCDLDETKICDNCGKCLNEYKVNEKGYIDIPIDKIITDASDESLEDLLKAYGLDDED